MDQPDVLQFGSIRGTVGDRWGKLLVLDEQAAELRVFTNVLDSGRGVGPVTGETVAEGGQGPGELQGPFGLSAVHEMDVLAVLEEAGRVSFFSNSQDEVLFSYLLHLQMDVDDACLLEDKLVVSGWHPEHPGSIHIFSLDGEWVRSFGEYYDSEDPMITGTLERVDVTCVPGGRIVAAAVFLSEVRLYDALGEVHWVTVLEGLLPVYVAEDPVRGVAVGTSEEGYHAILTVTVHEPRDLLLVQIAFVQRDAPVADRVEFPTYALDLGTGSGTMIDGELPRLMDLTSTGAIVSRPHPFPTLEFIPWPVVP